MVYEKSLIRGKGSSIFIATQVSSPEQFTSLFSREVGNEKDWSSGGAARRRGMRAGQQRHGSVGESRTGADCECCGARGGRAWRRLRAHESGERQCGRD